MKLFRPAAIAILAALPMLSLAQGTNVQLGGIDADPNAPVEVTAESLSVDQGSRSAIFEGNVVIGQGTLRISAGSVQVFYSEDSGEIARLLASGGVTFVTETEAAEAQEADYDLTSGLLTLTGGVLLTQGASALSAERMIVNLKDGTARMEGGVRTVFQQQDSN